MAEYRLDELARVSGVSARNIRAYRERGLLDPPRREGRSAYYDDYHLAQLQTITQLLAKGFNSAHIAEFFATLREGLDLADILGIHRAVLGPLRDRPSAAAAQSSLDIDPNGDEARKLLDSGLAQLVDGKLVLGDRAMGEIVRRATDQLAYVRAILRIYDATKQTIDELAAEIVDALSEALTSRFGPNYVPKAEQMSEVSRIVEDHRELANKVVADRLDDALRRRSVSAVSDYTAGILLSGRWDPKRG
ncbi:MerR family transcriptional regulator [Mycobacterium hubeiense]|uniref:MerR family transcriptional regulator n=1 Tax=Mycobacterium hubeiense TaxID=1867256 RepID=UPI000C7F3203|nr:MerR family transcriptional regulator [Mycobacterium sp. QGD 101]